MISPLSRLARWVKKPVPAAQAVALLLLPSVAATAAWLPPQTRHAIAAHLPVVALPKLELPSFVARTIAPAKSPGAPFKARTLDYNPATDKATLSLVQAGAPTLTVTSNGDAPDANPGDGACQTSSTNAGGAVCTLRAAIQESNALGGGTIKFAIPGGGAQTIALATQLPTISVPVTIDGYTQSGAKANTNSLTQGDNAVIQVTINATNAAASSGTAGAGLLLGEGSDNSTIRGLAIGGVASGGGILILNSSNNTIAGCFIGTDATGTTALPNALNGVGIAISSSNNTIGGTAASARNVISANGIRSQSPAVLIEQGTTGVVGNFGTPPGTPATGNAVLNNFIGTDATGANTGGTRNLGNGGGVQVFSASSDAATTTGTTISGNVISANAGTGVSIFGPQTSGTKVQSNFIGTGLNGVNTLPNGTNGVDVVGAPNNTIGGTSVAQGNLISQNKSNGVVLFNGANGNTVAFNKIGTDVNGRFGGQNGNVGNGVGIANANANTITDNVISANGAAGGVPGVVLLQGGASNVIQNNKIGTDIDGAAALGNGGSGIQLLSTSSDTTPITATKISGNVVSGNGLTGIELDGPKTTGTIVQNNKVGTDVAGNVAIPNGSVGLQLFGSTGANCSGNTISGNKNAGVGISESANNNTLTGNMIGTNAAGNAALGNGANGLFILDSGGNTIGTTSAGNVISGNGTFAGNIPGVLLVQTTSPNTVAGNKIGTNAVGSAALGNSGSGIQVSSAAGNVINANLIGGNAQYGIDIDGAGTTGTLVTSNQIGGNFSSNPIRLPNGLAGVQILNASGNIIGNAAAQGQTIGKPSGGQGNSISFNTGGGVALSGTGNTLGGNSVFSNGNVGVVVSANNNTVRQNDISGTTGSNIAGTFGSGMLIGNGCTGTVIQSNDILFNAGNGILFYGAAPGHTVGDPLPASGSGSGGATAPVQTNTTGGQTNSPLGNYIYGNGLAGVSVQLATQASCHRKSILGNSFGGNGTIPIDLGGSDVRRANQPSSNQGDKTTGPNALQNYPILSSVTVNGGNDTISGTLISAPNATFRIEFYSYTSRYIGYKYVTTNASGSAPISVTLADSLNGQGTNIAATATDAVGNTSEFSPAVTGPAPTTKINTATTLKSSANASTAGQSVTFTATVAAASGAATPTGTVTFKDGATTLGTGTLTNGVAIFSTTTLAQGARSITASYGGSSAFNTSTSAPLTQTVNAAPPVKTNTTTTLTSAPNPSTTGQNVTFTARVNPTTATGTVTFKDGATTLGTGTLNNGVATFATSTLNAGTHSITATYGGNANFNGSTSVALNQNVTVPTKPLSTTTLVSSLNPSQAGDPVTFTASVKAASGAATPTGRVTFLVDGVQLGAPVTLSANGTASSTATSTLSAGTHTITANYSGNANFNGSSATLTQTVTALPTLSINDVSAPEGNSGNKTFVFTVTLAPASRKTVTVKYATTNGTATAGSDYVANAGTLTFAPGVTTQTIPVTVNGDTTREANETFAVNLSGATNATLAKATGTGTIANDDFVADLSVTQTATPTSVPRGSQITFNVTVTNNGPDVAANVTLTDTLPLGATLVSSTPAQTSANGSTLTYALGTIASGASRTIALRVQTPDTIGTVTNSASVTQTGATDPTTANNTSTANATTTNGAPAYAYSVGKLTNVGPYSPSLYRPGGHFVQNVTITNNGTAPANGPLQLVLDGLPANVTLVGASGGTNSLNVPLSSGTLSVRQSVTLRLEFRLKGRSKPSFTPRVENSGLARK